MYIVWVNEIKMQYNNNLIEHVLALSGPSQTALSLILDGNFRPAKDMKNRCFFIIQHHCQIMLSCMLIELGWTFFLAKCINYTINVILL